MNKIILLIIEIARISTPFLIFSHPLLALLFSLILDSIDGQFFYNAGYHWEQYNLVDKLLDYWWYIFIVIFFSKTPIFPLALILLAYRTAGQFIGVILKNEKIYLFFPNILEWFFMIYIILPDLPTIFTLIMGVLWSLFVEWLIHVSNIHLLSKHVFHNEIKWQKDG